MVNKERVNQLNDNKQASTYLVHIHTLRYTSQCLSMRINLETDYTKLDEESLAALATPRSSE